MSSPVFDVLPDETTAAALRRLGFERRDCDCRRCTLNAGTPRFERRLVVRVADGAIALPCRTSVGTTIEWIRGGCRMPEAA